jgi:SAM-dependent methyltransferase
MANEYPTNFARFYDQIYHQLRDGVDHTFFLEQIENTRGKILEVGVGTGRFFIEALENGADIYGIDISKSMLGVLNTKLDPDQHHRVGLQNLVDFRFDDRFDLIVAPFRVIMHLQDKSDQLRALNNVHRHLKSGGRFIFDAFVPDLKSLIDGLQNKNDYDGEHQPGKRLRRFVSTKPDLMRQVIEVHFRIEWEEDDKTMQEEWEIPLRFFFRYELEHLVERSDFEQYQIFGDYMGSPLDENSKEFVVICRR